MTLVILFTGETSDYMIGDILISMDKKDARMGVQYPTKPPFDVISSDVITNMAQKIVQVAKGAILGYAGSLKEAKSLIEFLDFHYKDDVDLDSIAYSYRQFFSQPGKYLTLQAVLLLENGAGRSVISRNCLECCNFMFGKIILLGSGAEDFLMYLDKVAPIDSGPGQHAPHDADKIAFIMDYIASTLSYQKTSGFGIKDSWGGGFEFALKKNGKYLEKIDNVFFAMYNYSQHEGGQIEFWAASDRTFQFYSGDDLIVITQDGVSNAPAFFTISSPVPRQVKAPQIFMSDRRAQLVFVKFYDCDNHKSHLRLTFSDLGDENFSVQYLGGCDYRIDVKIRSLRRYVLGRHRGQSPCS